jgi:hemolysin activation/secretion protein
LSLKTLQRDLLRLNQNPDLEIRATLSPGAEPETSDIILKVSDKFTSHLGIGFDNQGTRLTGKYRQSAYLRTTNLTDNFDTFFMNTLYSSDAFGQSFSYAIPLDTRGTKFSVDALYFKMRLGKEFKSFAIRGQTKIYTPRITWELALDEGSSAYMNLGMDIKSIIRTAANRRTNDDQLRIPFFGFSFSQDDPYGQTSFSPRFNFSTENFLGASEHNHPSASRPSTGGFFFKYEHLISRIQRMPWESYLLISSQFQIGTHTLPSSEQFQLGGANSIRGYPEGDYLCDTAGNLTMDWIMPLYLIPRGWKLAGQKMPLRNQISWALFADVGGGKIRKVSPGELEDKFLAGVGGGLRFSFFNGVYVKLDWAKSVADRPTSGSGPSNFYVTFQSEL